MKSRGGCPCAHLIKEFAVLHLFSNALQGAEGLIEEDGQADAREILADALLDDGPQANALLALLWRGQPLAPWRRWQLLFKPLGDILLAAGPHSLPAEGGGTTFKSLVPSVHVDSCWEQNLSRCSEGSSSFFVQFCISCCRTQHGPLRKQKSAAAITA